MVFSLGAYGAYTQPVQGGLPSGRGAYPLATDTPPAGAPAGYPAEDASIPLDDWLPNPVSKMRYGGLFNNCDWQGQLYDTCSKTTSQAHKSGANMKWAWLGWRKGKVGQDGLSPMERAFFEADSGRSVASGWVSKSGNYLKKTVSSPKEFLKTTVAAGLIPITSAATLTTQLAGKVIPKNTVVGSALAKINRVVDTNPILERSRTLGTVSVGVAAAVVGTIYAAPAMGAAGAWVAANAGTAATVVGAAGAAVGVAKQTGLLPGTKPPATPGAAQPPLMDPNQQQAPPSALQAGMGTVGVVGGIAGLGLLALLAFTQKGRR